MTFKSIYFVSTFIVAASLFPSCQRETIVNPINIICTQNAVYILYEGGQSAGSGDYSIIDLNNNTISNNVYNNANGNSLNLYPDGIKIKDSLLYICAQGNFGNIGTFYKLNAHSNLVQTLNNAVINPYSFDFAAGKGFVTSGPTSRVYVFDVNTLAIIDTIGVGVYPQEVLAYNNRIYVGNQSVFGGAEDSTVSIIDASTNQVVATVNVGKDPNSIVLLNDGRIMVSSSGANRISIINGLVVQASVVTNVSFGGGMAVGAGNFVYLVSGANTVSLIDATNLSITNFLTANSVVNIYGMSFDKINNRLYLADAKNFTTNGEVFIYDSNANYITKYTTGIAPRRIIFR